MREKRGMHMVDFHAVMSNKSGIMAFSIPNLISSYGLKSVLAIFKTLHIFSLSATLTRFGTSVPPPYEY